MDKMITLLSGFSQLSGAEIELIRSMIVPVHFMPGELFRLSEWTNGRGITFLHKGVVVTRSQSSDENNQNGTNILIDAGNFLTNEYTSSVSNELLQSLTAIELMVLDNRHCGILSFLMPQWDKIMDRLQIAVLTDHLARFKNQTIGSARLRYLNLVEYYPAIAQQVPLRQIAHYLGITSQSLSRIRGNLAYKH